MLKFLRYGAAALLAVLVLGSFLPLVETNIWFIRYLDFPRMQFAGGLLLLGAILLAAGGLRRGYGITLLVLAVAALGYHGYRLWPYQPLAAPMIAQAESCTADSRLRVMVANVRRGNESSDPLLSLVTEQQPDILLVMETNERWDRALQPLDAQYPHHVQDIPSEATYYGMHLYSRHPLEATEVRFPFGADTPLIVTDVLHPAQRLRFFGVHPRPPQSFQPSTMRDATVLEAALEAGAGPLPAIVAGDFNGTPWERTVRRALRLGALVDPRAGRGPLVTFDAKSSWMKWPLDQILWQEGFGLLGVEVLPGIGSDHYPYRADLCIGAASGVRLVPVEEGDRQEAETSIEAARAMSEG